MHCTDSFIYFPFDSGVNQVRNTEIKTYFSNGLIVIPDPIKYENLFSKFWITNFIDYKRVASKMFMKFHCNAATKENEIIFYCFGLCRGRLDVHS